MLARLRRLARRARIEWSQRSPGAVTRSSIFSRIYREGGWGGARGVDFDSGTGSRDAAITAPYVEKLREFIRQRWPDKPPCIVDLGCGDFRLGAQYAKDGAHYVGVDIVPDLVQRNQRLHGDAAVKFECRDIVADELPPGDLCLVRQVLQHLSNDDIAAVLAKLDQYEEVLITEHVPTPGKLRARNRDKRTGPEIRLYWGSGVYLDAPPFLVPPSRLTELLRIPGHAVEPGGDPGEIVTVRLSRGSAGGA